MPVGTTAQARGHARCARSITRRPRTWCTWPTTRASAPRPVGDGFWAERDRRRARDRSRALACSATRPPGTSRSGIRPATSSRTCSRARSSCCLDAGAGERAPDLGRGDVGVIPAGSWHRVACRRRPRLLFITPVPATTEHRACRVWIACRRRSTSIDGSRNPGGASMALDPKLLEILACPEDKGPLLYFADEDTLYNPRLKRRYRVLDGDIPDLLIDDAETVDDAEHARLTKKAETDGIEPNFARLIPWVSSTRSPGCPSSSRRRTRRPRWCRPTRCRTPTRSATSWCSGMGGSGYLGRRRGRGVQRRAAGTDQRAEADPHARLRRAEHARIRDVVLRRHRRDDFDGAERGRAGRAARRGLVRRRARSAGARCGRVARAVPAGLPASGRGRRAGRAVVHACCTASGWRRVRTRCMLRAQEQLARRRDACGPASRRAGQSGA